MLFRLGLFVLISVFAVPLVLAQQESRAGLQPHVRVVLDSDPPPLLRSTDQLLAEFGRREARLRQALNHHTFKRDVLLQTIGPDGKVTGEYIRNSRFVFDDRGNRIEHVLYHPRSTLRGMKITKEDVQDLAGAQLLGLDITEAGKYRLQIAQVEILNSRRTYAVDVTPVQAPDPYRMRERFFVGRIWIDADTLQIVKVRGKAEPQGKQRFPTFETWREVASGDLLFPSRTSADDVLRFPKFDVHYRVHVRYYDYKLFASKVTLTEIDTAAE